MSVRKFESVEIFAVSFDEYFTCDDGKTKENLKILFSLHRCSLKKKEKEKGKK